MAITIDDGTGPVRVIAGPDALGAFAPARGDLVIARGPLGQRDSTGAGTTGYRLHATLAGELDVQVPPSPTPTPEPSPNPTTTPTPTASPPGTPAPSSTGSPAPSPTPPPSSTPAPSVTPSPASTAGPLTVAAARAVPVGSQAFVRGVVVAEKGRLGTPPLFVIADATGRPPVRVPDGTPAPPRGTLLEVRGPVADPYGQTELRPTSTGIAIVGTAALPAPASLTAGQAGEGDRGPPRDDPRDDHRGRDQGDERRYRIHDHGLGRRLAPRVRGRQRRASTRASCARAPAPPFTGIVGQRASRKGELDGYRLWVRDRADIAGLTQPDASSTAVTARPGRRRRQVATAPVGRVREGRARARP